VGRLVACGVVQETASGEMRGTRLAGLLAFVTQFTSLGSELCVYVMARVRTGLATTRHTISDRINLRHATSHRTTTHHTTQAMRCFG
jgi:hypothetical protein